MNRSPADALWAVVLLSMLLVLAGTPPAPARAQERPEPGALVGEVRDADTGEPVGWTQLLLEEANRSTAASEAGRFRLVDVPAGTYTLKTFRIGYEGLVRTVTIPSADTLRLVVRLTSTPITSGEVVVEGERAAEELAEAALALEGRTLRQSLGTTIAETLHDEPGMAMRSMGPAPARPVLRGLGGERLLVLEDGGRTGDLSATSSDHAVVIEPMTAERIEVVRGPAALVYGPNTLGGVVNVVRGYIPSSRPEAARVGLSMQGQSVNRGYAGGLSVSAPLGPLALNVDGSLRQARDVHTPIGVLENTGISTYNASLGTSVVRRHGYAGVAGGYYWSEYGIPGGFVGAHPRGVTVQLNRVHLEAKGEYFPHTRHMPRLEARSQFSRYFHQEFEAGGRVGVEFGVLSYHASLVGHTRMLGPFRRGAAGVWGEFRSYTSGGFSFTPDATEQTLAAFAYQEAGTGPVSLQGGLRVDYRTVTPEQERESRQIGLIRARAFGGLSLSLAGKWWPAEPLSLQLTLMRSLRMPGIEELYSEGPHLAAYSFEVGNPGLDLERGWGLEAALRYTARRRTLSLGLFHNYILEYIYPRNTGEIDVRTLLPLYQYTGTDVRMVGGEASAEWPLLRNLDGVAAASYVWGTLQEDGQPLPWIPPLNGKGGLRYRRGAFSLGTTVRAAVRQARLGEFEEPTDGYTVLDAFAQYYFSTGRMLHTLDLVVENLTDTEYRDHLSRVKSIMPEPGRNIKLLYKVYF